MALTKIEWADLTFNPWWGCERVSPACAHCYADTLATRYGFGETWGAGHGFRFFGDKHWADPLKWARTMPAKLGRRPRVFCASMADVFEERPELEEPRLRLFDLIEETPELDWLLLTKRPEAALEMSRPGGDIYWGDYRILQNVWIGVSIENARYTWRADVLREIPAAVRFISAEPLLGSLFADDGKREPLNLGGIDWCIIGGESGPKSRRTELDWIVELVEACESAGVAPFVKQLGRELGREYGAGTKGQDLDAYPRAIRVREFPRSAVLA